MRSKVLYRLVYPPKGAYSFRPIFPTAAERHYQGYASSVACPQKPYFLALVKQVLALCVAYCEVVFQAEFVLLLRVSQNGIVES